GGSQQLQDQAVDLLPPQRLDHVGSMGLRNVEQVNTLKTLEEPAQRGTGCWPAQLVRHRLVSRSQTLTHAPFCEPVDEQAQHHDEGQGHNALWFLHEDRRRQEEWILEKG